MSIEQTPPNLENDGIESDVERVSAVARPKPVLHQT